MIDIEKRKRLSVMMRQLGSGAMSIVEFEQFIEKFELLTSKDRSLAHLLSFASSYYDEDFAPIFLSRFRGRYRMKHDDRRRIAIATIFLRSNFEYQWPDDLDYPYRHDYVFLWLCALAVCGSFITFALSSHSLKLTFVGLALMATGIWLFWYARRYHSWMHEHWKKHQLIDGRNYDVWPFINAQEYSEALGRPYLFAGR